jgi:hypothetical protein
MTASLEAPVPAVRSKAQIVDASFSALEGVDVAALEPAHRVVPTIHVDGPGAPMPLQKSRALALATATIPPVDDGETALAALAQIGAPVPAQRRSDDDQSLMVTAYVPAIEPDPGAQLALKMIIEREMTGSITPPPKPVTKSKAAEPVAASAAVQIASLAPDEPTVDVFGQMMDATWSVVGGADTGSALANALKARMAPKPNPAFESHAFDLIAPDLEHVADTMVQQVPMSAAFFDELYEPEGWLDKTTELGPLVSRMGVDPAAPIPVYDRFTQGAPLLVASN